MRWARLALGLLLISTTPAWAADVRPVKISGQWGSFGVFGMCTGQTVAGVCTVTAGNIVMDFDGGAWNKSVTLYLSATKSTATTFSCQLKGSETGSASTLASTLGAAITNAAPELSISAGLPFMVWVDCTGGISGGGAAVTIDMKVVPGAPNLGSQ